jgi:hypothetical protein
MKLRNSLTAAFAAIAMGAPLASFADVVWIDTQDEAGTRIEFTANSAPAQAAPRVVTPPRAGDLSPDRQYVFLGEEGGWQLRPMEYRFEGGRLVHIDDPKGHMERLADSSLLTEQERMARERSGGS